MPVVPLHLYGVLREHIGDDHLTLDLPEGTHVREVLELLSQRYPSLRSLIPNIATAIGDHFVGGDVILREGDELVLLPPVSGGTYDLYTPWITLEPLRLDLLLTETETPHAGALLIFSGTVRCESEGRSVVGVEYDAYLPMAVSALKRIEAQVETLTGVLRCRIQHRIGFLKVGEVSLNIVVRSVHRDDGFFALRLAVEKVKAEVPIYKREVDSTGASFYPEGIPLQPYRFLSDEERSHSLATPHREEGGTLPPPHDPNRSIGNPPSK